MHAAHRIIPPLKPQDILRFWSKVRIRRLDECWEWTASGPSGYGAFALPGRPCRMRLSHRVAWTLAFGRIAAGLQICHQCDNRRCCNPRHLFAGTQTHNMRDAQDKGRLWQPGFRGERNGNSRLTMSEVQQIRQQYGGGGWTQRRLALAHGVCQRTITMIVNNITWRHVRLPAS